MPTVSMFLPNMTGASGLVMQLRAASDKTSINGDGDAMLEITESVEAVDVNTGWFAADVAETWSELVSVTVFDSDDLVVAAGWLVVGATMVVDSLCAMDAAYDPAKTAATQASVDALATAVQDAVLTVNTHVEAY